MSVKLLQEWFTIIYDILKKSGPHAYHLALVLIDRKPGDWIEYTVRHAKWVVSQIEELIELKAPLAFLEPEEEIKMKNMQFEDFSEVFARNNNDEIFNVLKRHPFKGIKYHNTNIPLDILDGIKRELTDVTLGRYFGYPECCIGAYVKNTAGNIFDYTEHRWCSPNCAMSIRYQNLYKEALDLLFPSHPELGSCFNPKRAPI